VGRVIAQQWMSVDGLVAGPHGEDDVFNAVEAFAPSETHNLALLEDVGEILLGRQTYSEWVQFWPTAGDEPMAARVNQLAKVVCSTSLDEAPWGDHEPATVVRDGIAHATERQGATGDTIVWGSIRLMRSLLSAAVLDEIELLVAPIALGSGTPLLGPDQPPVHLRLIESESWPGGVVRGRYAVVAPGTHP